VVVLDAVITVSRLVTVVPAVIVAVAIEVAECALVVGATKLPARTDGAAEAGRLVSCASLLAVVVIFLLLLAITVTVTYPGL
jgi:hypothetical protein